MLYGRGTDSLKNQKKEKETGKYICELHRIINNNKKWLERKNRKEKGCVIFLNYNTKYKADEYSVQSVIIEGGVCVSDQNNDRDDFSTPFTCD